MLQAIEHLRASPTMAHIPVIGFARELDDAGQAAAVARGATTAVPETAVLSHFRNCFNGCWRYYRRVSSRKRK